MKTQNENSLRLALYKRFFLASILFLCASNVFAKPLEPLGLFEYLVRLNDLRHSVLDPKTVRIITTESFSGCIIDETELLVNDPITNLAHKIQVAVYHPPKVKNIPAVLIVPTILGRTVIENSVAYRFCKSNMVAVIADINNLSEPATLPDWQLHDRINRKALIDLQTVVDLLETHPQVDPNKLAGYGLSLGGFTMSLLATLDPRLKSVALIASAGNMPAILSYSQQRIPVKLRGLRMNATKDTSLVNYENNLRSNIRFDPIFMANANEASRCFMFINLDDKHVPSENQLELWEKLGRPAHFDVSASHEQTILGAVTAHFNRVLNEIQLRLK